MLRGWYASVGRGATTALRIPHRRSRWRSTPLHTRPRCEHGDWRSLRPATVSSPTAPERHDDEDIAADGGETMTILTSKLDQLEARFEELDRLLADPEVVTNPEKLAEYGRERADLEEVVTTYRTRKRVDAEIAEAESLLRSADPAQEELAEEEPERLRDERERLDNEIRMLLVPKDPNDEKNVIVEIRAGTGGEEAALFAADLFRMYSQYAEKRGWKIDVMSANETGIGGFKEIIFEVRGRGAYSELKYESGVHRVQRVPVTESGGRIHTSTATVAVLPEAEEVDIQINEEDLRIDVFRSTGHGGQSVNTTDSAVRITHLPT